MKAKPVKRVDTSWVECPIEEMTHLQINFPSVANVQTLPAIVKGDRRDTPCWSWNGDTEKPTLKPSILAQGYCYDTETDFRCHSFITDGKIRFLADSTHHLAGSTVDLLLVQ